MILLGESSAGPRIQRGGLGEGFELRLQGPKGPKPQAVESKFQGQGIMLQGGPVIFTWLRCRACEGDDYGDDDGVCSVFTLHS